MSSFGVDPQLLLSPPANSDDFLPAKTRAAIGPRLSWIPAAIEIAADWATAVIATSGSSLAYQHFFAEPELHRSCLTILEASLCIASLLVFLLANDRAYRGSYGPLRIRQAEYPVRATVQASLLILLLNLMVGGAFPSKAIELSLLGTMLLLILEKHALFVFIATFSSPSLETDTAAERRWHRLIRIISRSAQRRDDDKTHEVQVDRSEASDRGYEFQKRILDLIFAIAAIVVALPFWMVAAVIIRLDSSGPVLFCQQRVGKNGRLFRIYKLRSMCTDAPTYEVSPNNPGDLRITRIGRILRQCSFDELPQLLNVVKGEMSLVGPRPEMPFLVQQHRAVHRERLQVVPGITGLWQLSDARASRIHENVQYDSYYVRNRSLSMDLAILLYTPVRMMRGI